ncbi:hypothetical protein [Crucivirus-536]|nr:hypothetical protein [Crucivirus-536]
MANQVNTYEDGWVNSVKGAPRGTFKRGSAARKSRDAPWRVKYYEDRKEGYKFLEKKVENLRREDEINWNQRMNALKAIGPRLQGTRNQYNEYYGHLTDDNIEFDDENMEFKYGADGLPLYKF